MTFTVEEMNLIGVIDHRNRRVTMFDIKSSMPTIEDQELKALCAKTLVKVTNMTDEEFAAVDFTVYEEDEDHE